MQKYSYDGPVMKFGMCIDGRWTGTTYARTEQEAKRNLIYQYKVYHDMLPTAKITLPEKLKIAN